MNIINKTRIEEIYNIVRASDVEISNAFITKTSDECKDIKRYIIKTLDDKVERSELIRIYSAYAQGLEKLELEEGIDIEQLKNKLAFNKKTHGQHKSSPVLTQLWKFFSNLFGWRTSSSDVIKHLNNVDRLLLKRKTTNDKIRNLGNPIIKDLYQEIYKDLAENISLAEIEGKWKNLLEESNQELEQFNSDVKKIILSEKNKEERKQLSTRRTSLTLKKITIKEIATDVKTLNSLNEKCKSRGEPRIYVQNYVKIQMKYNIREAKEKLEKEGLEIEHEIQKLRI